MVGTLIPSAHFMRSACEIFHGFMLRSMPLSADSNCLGNALSIMERFLRMSRMSRIGSLPTGQMSTHAPQLVQAHTASSEINSVIATSVVPPPLK